MQTHIVSVVNITTFRNNLFSLPRRPHDVCNKPTIATDIGGISLPLADKVKSHG